MYNFLKAQRPNRHPLYIVEQALYGTSIGVCTTVNGDDWIFEPYREAEFNALGLREIAEFLDRVSKPQGVLT